MAASRSRQAFETQLSDENRKLPFPIVHVMAETEGKFDAFLPRLRQFLDAERVLVVLDDLESLLPEHRWPTVRAAAGKSRPPRSLRTRATAARS